MVWRVLAYTSSNSHFPPLNSHHFGTDSHTPETKIVIKSLLRTQTSQLGKKVFGGEILLLLHSACKTCGFCLILLYYCSQINALEAMFFSPLAIGKWILLDFDGAGFLFLHLVTSLSVSNFYSIGSVSRPLLKMSVVDKLTH